MRGRIHADRHRQAVFGQPISLGTVSLLSVVAVAVKRQKALTARAGRPMLHATAAHSRRCPWHVCSQRIHASRRPVMRGFLGFFRAVGCSEALVPRAAAICWMLLEWADVLGTNSRGHGRPKPIVQQTCACGSSCRGDAAAAVRLWDGKQASGGWCQGHVGF